MSIIFRAWRRLPNGTILYAANYGLKAWPIEVDDDGREVVVKEKERDEQSSSRSNK